MPDSPSPFDDPFADLYGKLPDARSADTGAPTSRRAARQARAQEEHAAAPERPAEPVAARPAAPEPAPAKSPAVEPAAAEPVAATARAPRRRTASAPAPTPGTLDDLFTGRTTTDQVGAPPPRTQRRRNRTGGWIAIGIVVVLIAGVAGGGLWAWNTFGTRVQEFFAGTTVDDYAAGEATGEAQVTIASGDTGGPVSQKLYDAGVVKTPTSLYDYMVENNVVFTFQPGVYKLQQKMTSEAVLAALKDPQNKLENRVQLPEGLTVAQTVQRISDQMAIPLDQVRAAVDAGPAAYGVAAESLEGWLFPATYQFDAGVTAAQVLQRMVDRTVQSLDTAGVPADQRERILTIASIIQREARFEADFYKVSRVIQNRLDQGMKLQMDSTAQYGYGELYEGSASTSSEAQFDDNPWNTYVIDGLPKGPISNPGDLAIDAAMKPADGPWLFFVTVNLDTGETVFSVTADEHQAAVNQWIAWCKDHPDSGC
ncbi:endolytic transglycosylase MltG [Microbacterium sp. 10M-3C3]|uniref:endolytic transglycosylase MltG n=1 Tax=Microbacterium sp. 10M-3C3 TaxID=2483401 RepID=UPI000F6348E5|nr:endolytic transglycosylase MltG [Microbacterium sp. 10M-3C3]